MATLPRRGSAQQVSRSADETARLLRATAISLGSTQDHGMASNSETKNGRGRRLERIRASAQFNGQTFVNTHPVAAGFKPGVERPTMRDFLCGGERRVPAGPLPLVDPRPQWAKAPETGLRVTWFGHSSLLIEIDGVRLLTDPVWGQRASPLPFAGPKRFHPPVVKLAALPPIDAVIISHDHYDHLDSPAIHALAKTDVPFITSLGVGA